VRRPELLLKKRPKQAPEALFLNLLGGRLTAVYSRNDLGGAWSRDDRGDWEFEAVPGGEEQREMAFRIGINLAMYATCLDYKDDQVHLPFILKRRR